MWRFLLVFAVIFCERGVQPSTIQNENQHFDQLVGVINIINDRFIETPNKDKVKDEEQRKKEVLKDQILNGELEDTSKVEVLAKSKPGFNNNNFSVILTQNNSGFMSDCYQLTNISLPVVLLLMKGDFSSNDEAGKCFMKCYSEKAGYIKEDGISMKEKCVQYIMRYDVTEERANAIYESCKNPPTGDHKCDFAYGLFKCFFDNLKMSDSEIDFEDEDGFKAAIGV